MAKKDEENNNPAPKSNMKLIIVIVIGILIGVGAGIGGALVIMGGESTPNAEEEAANDEEPVKPKQPVKKVNYTGDPVFHKFLPVFVVNLPNSTKSRFLQVEVQVMARSDEVIENVVMYEPLIKNDLVALFTNQVYEDVIKPEGKELLREQATQIIKDIMIEYTGHEGIEQVLFTGYVTQ